MTRTVAIVGSFRKFYTNVCEAIAIFEASSLRVTSPLGASVVDTEVEFVYLDTDSSDRSPQEIQLTALWRILRSDLVYVVCPGGYLGRTTCYELGRIVQLNIPVYFSDTPSDLPIPVDPQTVMTASRLALHIGSTGRLSYPMNAGGTGTSLDLQRRLYALQPRIV